MEHEKNTSADRLSYQQTSLIQELVNCALACESCTSSCLSEHDVTEMAKCVELTRDCADICILGSTLMMRESEVIEQYLIVCEEICRLCAEECNKHEYEHCKICAEACESCADSCNDFHHASQH